MRDLFNVFFGFGDRRGKQVYDMVKTHDTFVNPNNPYNTTTTVNNRRELNGPCRSLNATAVIDRLFNGKLSQPENQTKSKYFLIVFKTEKRTQSDSITDEFCI